MGKKIKHGDGKRDRPRAETPPSQPPQPQPLAPPPRRHGWFLGVAILLLAAWLIALVSMALVSWRTWK